MSTSRYSHTSSSETLRRMVAAAFFCALAYLTRFFLHFNVMFLTFEIKDAVIAVGGLFLGPWYAVGMSFVVAILELVTISDTGIYGFLMNFLAAAVFSGVSAVIYRRIRTIFGVALSFLTAIFSMVSVMLVANLLVTPYFMGVGVGEVVGLLPTVLLPFNLLKATTNTGVVLALYKPLTTAMYAVGLFEKKQASPLHIKTLIVSIAIAAVLIAGSVLLFVFVLHGKITFS